MPTYTELTVVAQKKYRAAVVERFCYLTDGLTDPKLHDGTSLTNWGIQRPSTASVAAASSTGATDLDLCESLWTPVAVTLDDCESAWTLSGALASTADALCQASADSKVGSSSALTLIGAGIEPIDTFTKLMLHANGTDADTLFTDDSVSEHTLSAVGTAQLDTAQKAYGTASIYFPAAGDRITAGDHGDWDVGTGAYTFQCKFRIETEANGRFLFNTGGGAGGGTGKGLAVAISSAATEGVIIYQNGANLGVKSYTFAADTWYHLRVSRSGSVIYVFINGVSIGTYTSAGTDLDGGTEGVSIGGHSASANFTFLGWIDELRFDKGKAHSTNTDTFNIPTVEYGEFVELLNDPQGILGEVSTSDLDSPTNLSTYWGLQFWVKSGKTLADGDISLALCDSTSGDDELERCNIPVILAGEWTKVTYKFAEPATLSTVASLALILNKDKGSNAIYIDDVKAIRCRITLDYEERTEGNAALKIEIPGGVPANTLVATNVLASTNMSSDTAILMSLKADTFLGYQALQYLLDNTAACASPLESLYVTDDLEADTWHELSLSLAVAGSDTAIISEGLKVINKDAAPMTIWIDNIRRATSVAGNLAGRYYTWVSFYSSKYDRESDLSLISNIIDCNGQSISLSSIPVSTVAADDVDMRRIYRSQAGGTVPYLDQTIEDNTTTTVVLTTTDAAIGVKRKHPSGEAGAGSYNPPFASPYLAAYKQTIVTAGSIAYAIGTADVTNGSELVTINTGVVNNSMIGKEFRETGDQQKYLITSVNTVTNKLTIRPIDDLLTGTYKGSTDTGVAYTIIGDENAIHTSFVDDDNISRFHGFPPELVQTVPEGKPNDKITGIALVGDAFAVTKRFSTHVGEGTTAPWTLSKISDSLGCVAQDTMVQDEKGQALWLAGERGIVSCDGFEVKTVSEAILELFDGSHSLSFSNSYFQNAHAVYDLKKRWYWLFLTSEGATENDVALVLDRSAPDPANWNWYYFTGISAKSSCILYDDNGVGTIYIGDYDGYVSTLWSGYYDGIQSGTLSGTATAGANSTLTDSGASFATTGDGLKAMSIVKYTPSTGTFESKKIVSNNGTVITISGTWANNPVTTDKYYVGSYELDWYSKNFQFTRATDKSLLFDMVVNHQDAAASQKLRVQVSRDLGKTSIANQEIDLSDGEEEILLIRQRVQQAQLRISGYSQGQAIEVNAVGLRFKRRGPR